MKQEFPIGTKVEFYVWEPGTDEIQKPIKLEGEIIGYCEKGYFPRYGRTRLQRYKVRIIRDDSIIFLGACRMKEIK